jgi:hypothetical protein
MRNPPSPHPSLHPNRRERRHGRHRMEEPPRTMLAGRRVVVGVAAFAVASVGVSAVSAGTSNAPRALAAPVPGIDLSHTTTLPSTADELDAATGGSLDLPTLVAVLRAGAILGNSSAPGVVPDLSAALPNPVPGFSAGLLNPGSTAPGSVPQDLATATDIPARVLLAYRAAAARAALENPSCGIRWEFLAAFGRMETNHGRFGGSSVAENGGTTPPIYGAPLNGSRPGVIGTVTTASGAADRAAGPMQFISSTWAAWGRGGDVQNIDDATNGAARYLCAGGRDQTTAAGRNAAALSYNHADWYAADIEALYLDYVSGRHGASYPAQPPVDAPVAPTGICSEPRRMLRHPPVPLRLRAPATQPRRTRPRLPPLPLRHRRTPPGHRPPRQHRPRAPATQPRLPPLPLRLRAATRPPRQHRPRTPATQPRRTPAQLPPVPLRHRRTPPGHRPPRQHRPRAPATQPRRTPAQLPPAPLHHRGTQPARPQLREPRRARPPHHHRRGPQPPRLRQPPPSTSRLSPPRPRRPGRAPRRHPTCSRCYPCHSPLVCCLAVVADGDSTGRWVRGFQRFQLQPNPAGRRDRA